MKKTWLLLIVIAILLFSIYSNYNKNPVKEIEKSSETITSNTVKEIEVQNITEKKNVELTSNKFGELPKDKLSEEKSKEIIKEFTEGELVYFPKLKATDPDGKKVSYLFSKPLDNSGKWQTKEGDAGEYTINITATDGELNATQQVTIKINKLNHPPVLNVLKTYVLAKEGETLNLDAKVSDPDNDSVSLSFSGFTTTASKQISYDDAGKHEVVLIADDGKLKTTKKITIQIENVNRAPAFEQLNDVVIIEGEIAIVKPKVSDPDGDEVKLTFSNPLNASGEWQTKEGDAGEYLVNITATDGSLISTIQVKVVVETPNRAPKIELKESVVKVREGEKVVLNFNVSDAENDPVEVSISGWMTSKEKQTDFNSQGNHEVKITAKDPTHTKTETIIVEVENVNRVPIFDDGSFE